MPKTVVILRAVALAVGCDQGSDESEVEDAVRKFSIALLNGDGERACELMTATTVDVSAADISDAFQALTGEPKSLSCPDAVGLTAALNRGAGPTDGEPSKGAVARAQDAAADSAVQTLESGEGVGAIEVDGSKATVEEIVGLKGSSVELVKTDDGWLMSGLE